MIVRATVAAAPRPPVAARREGGGVHHGIARPDPHAWLRAENWQEVMRDPAALDAEIRAHLEAENAYTAAMMADTAALQARLVAEMRGRIREDDCSVPAADGPYAYYARHRDGGQHPLICRQPRAGGQERLLIDGDALAEGKPFFSLAAAMHAPDHRLMAYAVDETGSEYYEIRLRDLETGADRAEAIPDTAGGVVWSHDGASLFYVRRDGNHRPRWVCRHVVGTPATEDRVVYEEDDPGFFLGIGATQDRRFVLITVRDHETSEVRLVDPADPHVAPRLMLPRETGHDYQIEHHDGRLIILTNRGGEDYRIVAAPLDDPLDWTDLVAHVPGRLILSHAALRRHLVRLEREDGLPRIVVTRLADGAEHAIAFNEEAYALGLLTGYEFNTTTIRFSYSSPTTPAQIYDYDVETRARRLRKTQEVPSGHDPSTYLARRLHAPAQDGETVPVTVLKRRDTPEDGTAPCLLYGYGAYGITMPAGFSTNVLSLVDRGFVFAIAHVRGGKDKGFAWYRNGKRGKKVNTFTDYVAAAEHLIAERHTGRGRIVGQGGSAGGMLMGAVANMAPGLFAGIIAEVPFVDVLATMLDDTLPLTPPEWPEWGNPIASEDEYRAIAAWSPVDNVRPQAYPAILATGGLADPRVTYWEPAKWVARLRAAKTDANLLLLKTNMDAGHAGAPGRFDRLREVAFAYAFALKAVGALGREPSR